MTEETEKRGGGALALAFVFIGSAGFAACLTAVYESMRHVMVENGGSCASGGPYTINANQVCDTGDSWLLVGGIMLGLVFVALLLGGTSYYTDDKLIGVSMFLWAALFGALGWNFIDLGLNPPAHVDGAGAWVIVGIVFWVMALGGLIPGIYMVANIFRSPEKRKKDAADFSPPLVRAAVPFVRQMPGDPAFGMTDPTAADAAANAVGHPGNPGQAPPRDAHVEGGFVDPVTGEKLDKETD